MTDELADCVTKPLPTLRERAHMNWILLPGDSHGTS
jgi:hypothetical protein